MEIVARIANPPITGYVKCMLACLFLLFSPLTYSEEADDWEAVELPENLADYIEESFIELRFNATGDPFHRVMMTEDEEPYVDLKELLSTWLEMKVDCDTKRKYCQIIRYPEETVFWIDGDESQAGGALMPEAISFPKHHFIVKDDVVWVKYNVIGDWFKGVSTIWSLQYYRLAMVVLFDLAGDRKAQRERRRLKMWARQEQKKLFEEASATKPRYPYRAEARFSLNSVHKSSGEQTENIIYDIGADIFTGNLQASGGGTLNPVVDIQDISYWNYQLLKQKHFYLFELGATGARQTLLASGNGGLKDGIRIDKKQSLPGVGEFEYRGKTDPDTEVDLFINGFLDESIFVEDNGEFEVLDKFVAGGDSVRFELFLPDGSEETIDIIIQNDNGRILERNDWDYSFASGKLDAGQYSQFEFRYGLLDQLSSAVFVYKVPLDFSALVPTIDEEGEEVFSISEDRRQLLIEAQDIETLIYSMDIAYRPIETIVVAGEFLEAEDGLNYNVDLSVGTFDILGITASTSNTTRLNPFSVASGQSVVGKEHKLNLSNRIGRFGNLLRLNVRETSKSLDLKTGVRLSRSFKLSLDAAFDEDDAQDEIEKAYGITAGYQYGTNAFELLFDFDDSGRDTEFVWEYEAKTKNPWSTEAYERPWRIELALSKPQDGDLASRVRMSMTSNRYLQTKLTATEDSFEAAFVLRASTVNDLSTHSRAWFSSWRQQEYNDFAGGTVEGYVLSPITPGEPREPIAFVEVTVGGRSAITDEAGFYRVSGIRPYKKSSVSIDENSLDASMALFGAAKVLELRPATLITFNPELVWTAGFDGMLLTDKDIPAKAAIRITRKWDSQLASTEPLEDDGFFLVEGLVPGEYIITVLNVENPPPPFVFEIPVGSDWVSGIEIDWLSDEYKEANDRRVKDYTIDEKGQTYD